MTEAGSGPIAPVTATHLQAEPADSPIVDANALRSRILELMAEKTGYSHDFLEVEINADLDMEADLGVDTVKQAELFAVIRETYGIPRDDALRLRDLPTLGHVIRYVVERLTIIRQPPDGTEQT